MKISSKNRNVVLLPVPYGETVTYRKGTENGPRAILDASDNMESFDEELHKEIRPIKIYTADFLKVKGLGPDKMGEIVEKRVADVLGQGKFPVVVGGEHSVSVGAVKAARKKYRDLSVLYFDAHYDLRDGYKGSRYNHACVARRLLEIAPVVEAGVRSLSKAEFDFLRSPRKDIRIISMLDIVRKPDWYNIAKKFLSENIYISVDLDVFDPSIMPSVGTPEPGGLLWHDFLNALRNIIKTKRVVGFDVVELCPIKDVVSPDFMAARLIYKMLGYVYAGAAQDVPK